MIYKIFEIKEYPSLYTKEVFAAKQNQGFGLEDFVTLNATELKSILSVIFVVCLHKPDLDNNKELGNVFFYEENPYFKIPKDFGLVLMENLEGSKLEWYQDLLKAKYKLDEIFRNQDLIHFVNEALVGQMPIRQWEYGRFFLQRLFPILVDNEKWRNSKDIIYNSIKDQENPLLKMATIFKKANTGLNGYENFMLLFVLKEKLLKEEITMGDYMVISQIAQHKILQLHSRRLVLKRSFNSVIEMGGNLNKGRRGPRR